MGFPLDNVTVPSPYSFFMPGFHKDNTSNIKKMFTLLLEYPSFYTDFKQDASRLEPLAVWYSTLVSHKFAVGWFPFELNSKYLFFSCVKTHPLLPLSLKSFDNIQISWGPPEFRRLNSKFKLIFDKSFFIWISLSRRHCRRPEFLSSDSSFACLPTPISNLLHIFWCNLGKFILCLFKVQQNNTGYCLSTSIHVSISCPVDISACPVDISACPLNILYGHWQHRRLVLSYCCFSTTLYVLSLLNTNDSDFKTYVLVNRRCMCNFKWRWRSIS
jgi:hypothetical protein